MQERTRQTLSLITLLIVSGTSLLGYSCNRKSLPTSPLDTLAKSGGGSPAGYSLVWSDEFNGQALDTTKWTYEIGNLHFNNEKEFYQAANTSVTGGNLVITARHESVGGQTYTSSRLNTQNKFSFTYGRVEARIKMPVFAGSWPAFWMLGANINTAGWPTSGEIDIMEHVNTTDTIYGTMHWNSGSGHAQYGLKTTTTPGDYHVYAVEWTADSIKWYVDKTLFAVGNIHNNVNNTGAFQLPFFIILNMAVGGDLPGNTIDNSAFPAQMLVDYVRVYKKN